MEDQKRHEVAEELEERKEIVKNFILQQTSRMSEQIAILFEVEGVDYDFEAVFGHILEDLETEQDPDFYLLILVRYLYYTDKYDDLILPAVRKIPLWVTTGERLVCFVLVVVLYFLNCSLESILVGEPYDHVHVI